jgi:hypothetical protein
MDRDCGDDQLKIGRESGTITSWEHMDRDCEDGKWLAQYWQGIQNTYFLRTWTEIVKMISSMLAENLELSLTS